MIVRQLPNVCIAWLDASERKALTCLLCGRTSWHPTDHDRLYCGQCGDLAQARMLADAGRECFDPWPGLSPFAAPLVREEAGLPSSWWTRPTWWGAFRCRWGRHSVEQRACAILLDTLSKMVMWSGGYPFANVDGWKGKARLVRLWYAECDRCGAVEVPAAHKIAELKELLGDRFAVSSRPDESTHSIIEEIREHRARP